MLWLACYNFYMIARTVSEIESLLEQAGFPVSSAVAYGSVARVVRESMSYSIETDDVGNSTGLGLFTISYAFPITFSDSGRADEIAGIMDRIRGLDFSFSALVDIIFEPSVGVIATFQRYL